MQEKCFENLKYLVKYPKNFSEDKKYPTIIFLHGAGSRGQDFEKLGVNPFFTITKPFKLEPA